MVMEINERLRAMALPTSIVEVYRHDLQPQYVLGSLFQGTYSGLTFSGRRDDVLLDPRTTVDVVVLVDAELRQAADEFVPLGPEIFR